MNGQVEDKLLFENNHKFSIACENSSHPGYVTEKILQAFAAKTIPIYYGDSTVCEDFNSKAFINCHEFDSLDHLLEKVKKLDSDKTEYLSMLEQPIYNDKMFSIKMKDNFDKFIENIFIQEKEKAFRRNRVFWGKKIDDKYIKLFKFEQLVKKGKKVLTLGKKNDNK